MIQIGGWGGGGQHWTQTTEPGRDKSHDPANATDVSFVWLVEDGGGGGSGRGGALGRLRLSRLALAILSKLEGVILDNLNCSNV